MATPLDSIPFYGAYRQRSRENEQAGYQDLQKLGAVQGVLANMRKAQEEQQVKDAITSSQSLEEAIPKLQQTEAGRNALVKIMQIKEGQARAATSAREQQFFSPESRARFMTPGQPAAPEEMLPEGIAGPPQPARAAVAPTFDMERFAQEGVMSGVKGAEPLLNHLAQREQARAALTASQQARREALEARLYDIETRSQDRALSREQQAELARQADMTKRYLAQLIASSKQPPSGVAVMGPDGKPVFVPKGQEIGMTPASSGAASDRQEQKGAMADYAETLVSRLETLLETDPRSTTGIFSGPVRGVEAVTNAVVPGAIGSQATIAKQTKEQLISVLGQIRGGGAGRLSNQDMRRVDTAIGQLNTGTPEGMAQGLKDAKELISAMRGTGAAQPERGKQETKVLNGKTYTKINGQWYEQ